MTKDKQIEEMAFNLIMATSPLGVKDLTKTFDYKTVAADLYELYGWRKASEVAREIVEDVATLIEANWNDIQHGTYWLTNGRCTPLRELLKTIEKKYTEGEG